MSPFTTQLLLFPLSYEIHHQNFLHCRQICQKLSTLCRPLVHVLLNNHAKVKEQWQTHCLKLMNLFPYAKAEFVSLNLAGNYLQYKKKQYFICISSEMNNPLDASWPESDKVNWRGRWVIFPTGLYGRAGLVSTCRQNKNNICNLSWGFSEEQGSSFWFCKVAGPLHVWKDWGTRLVFREILMTEGIP